MQQANILNLTEKIRVSQIRSLNLTKETVLSFDYEYQNSRDNYYIVADGKRIINCTTSKIQRASFNKIRGNGSGQGDGYGWGWVKPQLTDEEQGLIQAAENGENPFAFSIICSNPELNGTFK